VAVDENSEAVRIRREMERRFGAALSETRPAAE